MISAGWNRLGGRAGLGRARERQRGPGVHRVDPSQHDAGIAAVSVAILFPAILALVFTVIQAGIYYHTQQWAAAAADRAVDRAAQAGSTLEEGQAAGLDFLAGSICGDPLVEPSAPPSGPGTAGERVRFTVTCQVPGPLASIAPEVSATSTAPVERFIPETERS